MTRLALILLLLPALSRADGWQSRSEPPELPTVPLALAGQAADVGTTAWAVSLGAAEANPIMAPLTEGPLGFVAMAGIKLGVVYIAAQQPPDDCAPGMATLAGLGWGAAANNIAVIAGASVAWPIGVAVGLAVGVGGYRTGWARAECEALRR